jgi:hypothetical protein
LGTDSDQVKSVGYHEVPHRRHVSNCWLSNYVGNFMIDACTKFHIRGSSTPLVIAMKLKAKEKFRMDAMLLFHILKNNLIYHNKITYFSKIYTSFEDPKLRVDRVASTLQVCMSVMLLLIVGRNLGGPKRHNINTQFRENRSFVYIVKKGK